MPRRSQPDLVDGSAPDPLPWLRTQTSRHVLERQVQADRERRHEQYLHELSLRSVQKAPTLRILAEGDSWFEYPLDEGGVIDHLSDLMRLPIDNMAHHGDEARQMLGLKQRKEIERRLQSLGQAIYFDALLFSAGGNDFAGDPFCLWLKPFTGDPADLAAVAATDPASLIDENRFGAVLTIVEAGFRDLIEIRDRLSPSTHLFFHGYDYAKPDGRGVCGQGPWLKPGLEYRQIPAAVRAPIIKLMIQSCAARISALADPQRRIHYVPTPGTLDQAKHWANELHPTSTGFALIAEKFRDALRMVFPDFIALPRQGKNSSKSIVQTRSIGTAKLKNKRKGQSRRRRS